MPLNLITVSDTVFLAATVCGSLIFSIGLLVLVLRIHARIANARQLRAAWSRLDRSQPRPDSTTAARDHARRLAVLRAARVRAVHDAPLSVIEPDERLARAAGAPAPRRPARGTLDARPSRTLDARPSRTLGDNPTHRRP